MSHRHEPVSDLDLSQMRRAVAMVKVAPIVFVTPVAGYVTSDQLWFCTTTLLGSLALLGSCWADRQWRRAPQVIMFTSTLLLGIGLTWLSTGPWLTATDAGRYLSISSGMLHDVRAGFPLPWLNGQAGFGIGAQGYANGIAPDPVAYYCDVATYTVLILLANACLPIPRQASAAWWVHGAALIVAAFGVAVLWWRVLLWDFRY